jgi:hypothetical protein
MAEREKAYALLEEADRIGLRIGYDEGFVVVTRNEPVSQRSDDPAETERAIVEQLGEYGSEVFDLAAATARAARASTFFGQQAFIPKEQIIGKLVACDSTGKLTVSYFPAHAPQARNPSSCDIDGGQIFIIVDGDERSDPASSVASPWLDDERLRLLLLRAEALGLRLALDSAFILVRWSAIEGVEKSEAEAMIQQLGKRITEVAAHLFALVRGERGAAFVGQRVFVPELGFGILTGCSADGNVQVSYRHKDLDSQMNAHCSGKSVLILAGGCEETVSAPSVAQNSEAAWRRLVRRAFGG